MIYLLKNGMRINSFSLKNYKKKLHLSFEEIEFLLESYHGLHSSSLSDLVLADVQIQSLSLEDSPFSTYVPHFAIQKLLQWGQHWLMTSPNVFTFNLPKCLFSLADSNKCWSLKRRFERLEKAKKHNSIGFDYWNPTLSTHISNPTSRKSIFVL